MMPNAPMLGVCPCCEEVHVVIPPLRPLTFRDVIHAMSYANAGLRYVMAPHNFGEYGSRCCAGSPLLLPPERLVEIAVVV